MASRLEDRIGTLLGRFVDVVSRHPRVVLALALLVTLLSGSYAAFNLGVNADTDALFDAKLPFRKADLEIRRDLPHRYNNFMVVIDAPSELLATDVARELVERIRADDHFESVFAPGVGPFFERNGLLYMSRDDLEDLADDLASVQPLLAEAARDPSVRGLFSLLTRAALNVGTGQESFDLSGLFDQVIVALRDAQQLQPKPMRFGDLIVGVGDAKPRRYVLARPRIDYRELLFGEAAMKALHEMLHQVAPPGSGVRARVTGDRALEVEEFALVESQATGAGIASLLLVSAILWFALRSGRLILGVVVTLLCGLVWTAGFAALVVGHLNVLSIAFAVLFIGLGVDFGTHFTLRYRELRREHRGHRNALVETARGVGSSLGLCALTTAVGFYAFVPTPFSGVAELGLISGTGMLISLFGSLTVLPALMTLRLRDDGVAFEALHGGEVPLPSWPMRVPRLVCGAAALLAVGALFLLPKLHFDANPLRMRDPSAESVKTFYELLDEGDVNPWSIEVLEPDLAKATEMARKLEALPSVESATTLASYVLKHQPEKLAIIGDMATFLGLSQVKPVPPPSQAQNLRAMAEFRDALTTFARSTDSDDLAATALRLRKALNRFLADAADKPDSIAALRVSLVDPILERLQRLGESLQARPFGLGDLPKEIRARMLTADRRALVEVHPEGSLNDEDNLRRFVSQVRGLAPRATGTAVFQQEAAATVVRALKEALLSAIPLVTLLLVVLWRSPRDTALVMAPLLLAALFTSAVCVLIGLPINFANVIVIPLLLGIGVDSGIHLVHRYRALGSGARNLMETSTSRAVLWSALTTAGSFASLAFSGHRGLASLGQLLTLGVSVTLLCNLLLLPALLALTERRRTPDSKGNPKAREGARD